MVLVSFVHVSYESNRTRASFAIVDVTLVMNRDLELI